MSLGARLREAIVVDGDRAHDSATGHTLALPLGGARTLAHLDERALRTLQLCHFLDGVGDAERALIAAARAGTMSPAIEVLDDARFECQSSGDCCRSYALGPLTDEDVARLDALDLARFGPVPHTEERHLRAGGVQRFLRRTDAGCVFLDGARCGLHAAFGAASKPALCRLYPLVEVATPFGRRVFDHGECATFSTSGTRGPLLRDDLTRIGALLPARPELVHGLVWLDGELACDAGHLLPLGAAALRLAAVEAPLGHTLAALGRLARAFTSALASCAPGPEGAAQSIAPIVAAPAARWLDASAFAVEDAFAVDDAVADAVRSALGGARQLLEVQLLLGAERSPFGHLDAPSVSEALDALRALPPQGRGRPLEAAGAAALRRSLRHQLFSEGLLLDGRVEPALERLVLVYACALAAARGAKPSLLDGPAGVITLPQLDRGHAVALRALRPHAVGAVLAAGAPGRGFLVAAGAPRLLGEV